MYIKLFSIIILIILLFIACNDVKERTIKPIALDALDTLTRIDYLFYKKTIPVKDSIHFVDQLTRAMAIDKNGYFYFVGLNQEVYKIDSDGVIIKRVNNAGRGPGEYSYINAIVTDSNCNIYVADMIGLKIIKYDSSFNYLTEIRTKSTYPISGITINSDGNLVCYHPSDLEYAVYVYDNNTGELLDKFGIPDKLAHKFGSYSNNSSLNYDNKSLYYINPLEYKIYKYVNGIQKKVISPGGTDHFTEINKPVINRMKEIRKYSLITSLYLIRDLFIVGINNVIFNEKPINAITKFDIIDQKGIIIKSQLPFNDNTTLIKIDNKHFFSFLYKDSKNSDGFTLNIVIYTLKI